MLQNLINSLDRTQLLAAINDDSVSVDTLRSALFHCLNGATPAPTAAPVAPLAAAKTTKAAAAAARAAIAAAVPAAPVAVPAPIAAPAGATSAAEPADAIVAALAASGAGFAVANVIDAGAAHKVTRSMASSAIKRAVTAGTLFGAGKLRFKRYGATLAIATAASTTGRG